MLDCDTVAAQSVKGILHLLHSNGEREAHTFEVLK